MNSGHRTSGRRLAVCIALLFGVLLNVNAQAQTVHPRSDRGPGKYADSFVEYVGHFGETFKLRDDWQIKPAMQGAIEVINYYPKYRADTPPESLAPFTPKTEDFAPENFSRLGLVQLLIIPRSDGDPRRLFALKEEKIRDLRASGARFQVIEDPFFGPFRGHWPDGTFEISVTAPYQLSQLYTATPSQLCILTSGVDSPGTQWIGDHARELRYDLAAWIVPQKPAEPDDEATTRAIVAKGISLHPFSATYIWMSWAVITGLACFFAGLLDKNGRRNAVRRISFSVLVFSNGGAILGGILGLAFWPFPWSTRHLPAAAAIACFFTPSLAFALGRVRKAKPRRLAVIGAGLWGLIAFAGLAYASAFDWGPGSQYVPAFSIIISFVFYAAGGVIFGALDSSGDETSDTRSLLALMLIFVLGPKARAQTANLNEQARILLADKGITERSFIDPAKEKLRKTGAFYDFQRVEIKGIWSPNGADNDTNALLGPIFDKQIAPTHLSGSDGILNSVKNHVLDLNSLSKDEQHELSKAAEAAVTELANKRVNEIVAHSWGTEIVYNAILAGKIPPPRRLIVCGMPDRDLAKWAALSKYTGAEVVVYTDDRDPAAGSARKLGTVRDETSAAELSPLGQVLTDGAIILNNNHGDRAAFEAQWANACKDPNRGSPCNAYQRPSLEPVYRSLYQGKTHDRLEYYKAMITQGDIHESAPALQAAQDDAINKSAHSLYLAAVKRKREVLEEIANADKDSSSFFDGAVMSNYAMSTLRSDEAQIKAREEEARRKYAAEGDDHTPPNRAPWQALTSWASIACSYMEGGHPGDDELAYLRGHYVVMSRDDIDAWLKREPHMISSCQRSVIVMARDASDPLNVEWMIEQMTYRRGGGLLGVIVRGIASGIETSAKALVHGIKAPFVSGPGAEGSSDGSESPEPREPRTEGSGPERHSPDNWGSLNQLRGFAGFQ